MLTLDRMAVVAARLAHVRALLKAGDASTDDQIASFIAPTMTEALRDATTPRPIAFVHDDAPRRERDRARCPAPAW